jgi:signal transduction histidine kinase
VATKNNIAAMAARRQQNRGPSEFDVASPIVSEAAALRQLADHIDKSHEEEKRRIAAELHDEMGATLTSLSMHLDSVYALFPDEQKWRDREASMRELLFSMVATTRRIQADLRPPMLDLFGIRTAIGEYLEDFRNRSGITCVVSLPDDDVEIGNRLEITIYRMLQQILDNIVRHAHATRIDVILDIDDEQVALTVLDDGVGISANWKDASPAFGLRWLWERANFLGGTLIISANKNKGTKVAIALPLIKPN